jgi:hypothetical protein
MSEMTWQPIDTAPRDGSRFLAYLPDEAPRRQIEIAWQNASGVMAVGAQFSFDLTPVTHWMPLPAPPAGAAPRQEGAGHG